MLSTGIEKSALTFQLKANGCSEDQVDRKTLHHPHFQFASAGCLASHISSLLVLGPLSPKSAKIGNSVG